MSSIVPNIYAQFPESVLLVNQLPTAVNFDLYKASAEGSVTLVTSLLASGGKPNFINISDGQKTSLHIAAENGHSEIVGLLLRNGAEINCIVGTTKASALTLAAEKGHISVIKKLLSSTPEPSLSHKNGYGNTALHEAARGCFFEAGTLLLDHSCRSNPTALLNRSPSPSPITTPATATSLSSSIPPTFPPSSASSSHSASPLVTIINNKGSTPLHFLCYSEEHSAESILFAEAFLQYGSDVNARDNKGVTPILVCCTHGRSDLIELFVANGGDIKIKDNIGKNALETAAFYAQEKLFPYLKSFNL